MEKQATVYPPMYAQGYGANSWDDFRVTGGRYVKTNGQDYYTRMKKLREQKLQPITE